LFALVFYILLDLLFVEPDGGRKISYAPDAAVEVDVLDESEFSLQMHTGTSFEFLHDGSNRDIWRYFNLDMDMILINIDCVNVERRIFFNSFVKAFEQLRFYVFFQILSAISGTPDYVILVLVSGVI